MVTSSRSDFGLVRPILKHLLSKRDLTVSLACVGDMGKEDRRYILEGLKGLSVIQFKPAKKAATLTNAYQMARIVGRICQDFSEWLAASPQTVDLLFLPGDRFEIFSVACAGYYSLVPIAHIFGGDKSEGGHLDDNIRHAITKLAHIHFAVSEDSAERIRCMGEEPRRVFHVGSPVVEAVHELFDGKSENQDVDWPGAVPDAKKILFTYLPITSEPEEAGQQAGAILDAMDIINKHTPLSVIATFPNNEPGAREIIKHLNKRKRRINYRIVDRLGWRRYLLALKNCNLVIGNSSSGLLEAPIVGVRSLDIGPRQKGRLAPPSVTHIDSFQKNLIAKHISRLLKKPPKYCGHPYGEGNTGELIYKAIKRVFLSNPRKSDLRKRYTC